MMMNLIVARLSVNGVDIQSVCEEKTEFFFLTSWLFFSH